MHSKALHLNESSTARDSVQQSDSSSNDLSLRRQLTHDAAVDADHVITAAGVTVESTRKKDPLPLPGRTGPVLSLGWPSRLPKLSQSALRRWLRN